jgi:hypothetical protein
MNDHHNQSGFITFLAVLAFNLVFFAYVSFFHDGVKGIDTIGKQTPAEVIPVKQ